MTDEVDTEEKENSEFEDAFNAEAEKRDGVASDSLPDDDPDKIKPEAGSEAEEQPGTTDTSDGGDPEASAGADTEASAGDDEEDPFEGWPQEAIDRYKSQVEQTNKLQHRVNSDAGRVSAFQKKVTGLETQIEQIANKGGEQPSKEDIADAMGSDEKWAQFQEDFPEVADAIDSRLNTHQETVNTKVNTTIAPVIEKQEQDATTEAETKQQENVDAVAETFPTWQTEVQKQEFSDWIENQSPGIKALGESDDPADASSLIGQYDDYRVKNGHPTMRTDPEPDNGVNNEADELAKRRARQLEDGTTLPSKNARVDTEAGSGSEFEDAFNAFAARQDAKRQ